MKKIAEYERQELIDWLESIVNSTSPEAKEFTDDSAAKVLALIDTYESRENTVIGMLTAKRPHDEIRDSLLETD